MKNSDEQGGSVRDIRSSPGFQKTILIIDDQQTILTLHTAILKIACPEANMVCMTDPVAALEWSYQKEIDLIVMDYRMGRANGIHFINGLNKSGRSILPPIIVVTAITGESIHHELLEAGVSICLTKPVSIADLSEAAHHLLGCSPDRCAQSC